MKKTLAYGAAFTACNGLAFWSGYERPYEKSEYKAMKEKAALEPPVSNSKIANDAALLTVATGAVAGFSLAVGAELIMPAVMLTSVGCKFTFDAGRKLASEEKFVSELTNAARMQN